MDRKSLGLAGEKRAEAFLRAAGMKLIARRFAAPGGEIDLIMSDGREIVFVEVKTRRDDQWTEPEAAVNAAKQRHLASAARHFIHRKRLEDRPCRFDIVAIVMPEHGEPTIRHFPDAFAPRRG
jgi:putative endonuclease